MSKCFFAGKDVERAICSGGVRWADSLDFARLDPDPDALAVTGRGLSEEDVVTGAFFEEEEVG